LLLPDFQIMLLADISLSVRRLGGPGRLAILVRREFSFFYPAGDLVGSTSKTLQVENQNHGVLPYGSPGTAADHRVWSGVFNARFSGPRPGFSLPFWVSRTRESSRWNLVTGRCPPYYFDACCPGVVWHCLREAYGGPSPIAERYPEVSGTSLLADIRPTVQRLGGS
jgi:hypothetical protein